MKRFSLYGLNNSNSIVFVNVSFGEIKDHSLRTTILQEKKIIWKFCDCVYLT